MLNRNGKLANPEVRIETTNYCNASCSMCAHDKMTRPKGTMKVDFFDDLVKQAKDLGATTISPFGFGEPLIDQRLVEKIEICRDLELETFVTTNGTFCSWQKIFDLFTAGLTHIRFSVHGIEADNYEIVQKGLDFDNVMTNVFSTIQLRNSFFPERKVSLSVISQNDETVEQIRALWELTGIDWLEIWRPHNWATKKQFRAKTNNRRKCFRPVKGPLQIQWDGKVIPCCFITDAEIVLGNAYEQTLEEILKGKAYSEFKERHEIGDLEGLPCNDCDQRNEEQENPLLYSSRDKERKLNCTSSTKFLLN